MGEIEERIAQVLSEPAPVLFAGAGIGVRIGLPDWSGYVGSLAEVCEQHGERLAAELIRQRISEGDLSGAVTVYNACRKIPSGVRLAKLAAPFKGHADPKLVERLHALVTLRFTGIATTNFDLSLHDAYAQVARRVAIPFELDDGSLKRAAFNREFYIARIHGRAERPESLVLDSERFRQVADNVSYIDYILHILTSRTCLFIGYSFLDPAISHILSVYGDKVIASDRPAHCALIPTGSTDLADRLRSLNIYACEYDPSDGHKALWSGIRSVSDGQSDTARGEAFVGRMFKHSATKHFLAFAYAQSKTRDVHEPLLRMTQDGIVMGLLPAKAHKSIAVVDVIKGIQQHLHITEAEASKVVEEAIGRLKARGDLRVDDERVSRTKPRDLLLEQHFTRLVEGVKNRMAVRDKVQATRDDGTIIAIVLEEVFVARAWDLGAHFAGAPTGWGSDLGPAMLTIVRRCTKPGKMVHQESIAGAIQDLLVSPDATEADHLAELGRCAFALQLVLATPRQVLFQEHALPQRIYLDANVLMPAVIDGHPMQRQYASAIAKLREATQEAGLGLEILVGNQFLNEVISHRRIARDLIRELKLEDRQELKRHILFYGAQHTNAFINAYASHCLTRKHVKFAEFLKAAAPFDTEAQLSKYLLRRGIQSVPMSFEREGNQLFSEGFGALLEVYESSETAGRRKEKILIEHEARQVARLRLDAEKGLRAIFVTADFRLLRLLQRDQRFHDVASMTISQLGLVAMVDLFIGDVVDKRALARMMWGRPRTDEEGQLREYFIALALRKYDAGMALELKGVVDAVASNAREAALRQGIDLLGTATVDAVVKAKAFVDMYEAEFFEKMKGAIAERERKLR